jgi:hypothetical protein
MPSIDELVTAPVIHATRPDGAILTAIRVPTDDLRLNRWGWMLYISQKGNASVPSDIEALTDHTGKRYPKIYTLDEVKAYAAKWGDIDEGEPAEVDWNPGYWNADPWGEIFSSTQSTQKEIQSLQGRLADTIKTLTENINTISRSTDERLDAQIRPIVGRLEMTEKRLTTLSQSVDTLKPQVEEIAKERRRQRQANDLLDKSIQATAFEIAKQTNEYTMEIISEQVGLGSSYYQNAVLQSKQSFDLSRLLVLIGVGIFAFSMVVLFIPVAHGNTTPVGVAGVAATAITEGVAGLNFLYNKASDQLAQFHRFLDRNNRASIAHAMCNGIKDETRKQEMIIAIIQDIMKDTGDTK